MGRFLLVAALALLTGPLAAQLSINRPGEREFVLDLAGVLSESDKSEIRAKCDALLTAKAAPIVVVVIRSMANHGGQGMSIEAFATALFNQWGIGHPTLHGKSWNMGILLLVATEDRRARIELGAGWPTSKNAECQRIMDELMVPAFKRGDYPAGVKGGVSGLEAMANGLEPPKPPIPLKMWLLFAALVGLGIFTVVSLVRRGSSGWAWLFWGAVFALLSVLLMGFLRSRGRSSGGGFSGGSFGGGFSGGGGASGSW